MELILGSMRRIWNWIVWLFAGKTYGIELVDTPQQHEDEKLEIFNVYCNTVYGKKNYIWKSNKSKSNIDTFKTTKELSDMQRRLSSLTNKEKRKLRKLIFPILNRLRNGYKQDVKTCIATDPKTMTPLTPEE